MSTRHRRSFWHAGLRCELRDWHDAPTRAERAAGWTVVKDPERARWLLGSMSGLGMDPGSLVWSDDAGEHGRARLERLLDELRLGRTMLVVNDVRPAVDPLARVYEGAIDLGELAGPEPEEATWVEFVFEYPDGTKVSGLRYVLIDPSDRETPGTLADSGTITRRGVAPGEYAVVLEEVEHAVWRTKRARADEDLVVVARTSGYPDGTAATVKLYRERIESAGDEIATVDAVVTADVVEATFRWDEVETRDEDTRAGVVSLVAEVSVDDGRAWAKTMHPLRLELPTLRRVEWSAERADAGETIDLLVHAPGYPDGTPVALKLWAVDVIAGDREVGRLPAATVHGGAATARVTYAADGATATTGATIGASGEYYVVATIEGSEDAPVPSGLLWCAWVDDDDAAQGDGATQSAA